MLAWQNVLFVVKVLNSKYESLIAKSNSLRRTAKEKQAQIKELKETGNQTARTKK